MNGTVGESVVGAVLGITLTAALSFFFGFMFGSIVGQGEGHREVASGQVICVLKENRDKTTYWVCSPAQHTHK